jgi:hypothetical protein
VRMAVLYELLAGTRERPAVENSHLAASESPVGEGQPA